MRPLTPDEFSVLTAEPGHVYSPDEGAVADALVGAGLMTAEAAGDEFTWYEPTDRGRRALEIHRAWLVAGGLSSGTGGA